MFCSLATSSKLQLTHPEFRVSFTHYFSHHFNTIRLSSQSRIDSITALLWHPLQLFLIIIYNDHVEKLRQNQSISMRVQWQP